LPTYVERKNNFQAMVPDPDYLEGDQTPMLPEPGVKKNNINEKNPDYLRYLNALYLNNVINYPYLDGRL